MENYRRFSGFSSAPLDLTLRLGFSPQFPTSSNALPVDMLDLTLRLGLPSQDFPIKDTNGKNVLTPRIFEFKNVSTLSKKCNHCGNDKTPVWRKGPQGKRTLCNACGLRYARVIKKRLPKFFP